PLGLDVADFAGRRAGGWTFAYIDALASVGIASIVVCFSKQAPTEIRHVDIRTGTPVVVLPSPWVYRRSEVPPGRPTGRLHSSLRPYLDVPVIRLARLLRAERCRAVICQEYEYARFDVLVALG